MITFSGLFDGVTIPDGGVAPTTTTAPKRVPRLPDYTAQITQTYATITGAAADKNLVRQLQCLLNMAMNSPDAVSRFVSWQETDKEGWALASAWQTLAVDGVIKTKAQVYLPEAETIGLLSRAGVRQLWIGDIPNFGPDYVNTNAGAFVQALISYLGANNAVPCDYPAQAAAAAAQAAAEIAAQAAAAAAQAQAEADAMATSAVSEVEAQQAREAQEQADAAAVAADDAATAAAAQAVATGIEPSPGMQVTQTVPTWGVTDERKRWIRWGVIGAGVLGVGLLVVLLARR